MANKNTNAKINEQLILIGRDKPLTKTQILFNKLSKKIDKLKKEIESNEIKFDKILNCYVQKIIPLEERIAKNKMDMAELLDVCSSKWKLNKRELSEFGDSIVSLFEDAIFYIEPNKKQQDIFNKWSGENYDELIEAERREVEQYFNEHFKNLFNIDVDFSQLNNDDPESFAQFKATLEDKMKEANASNATKSDGDNRKKSKKQLEKEFQEREVAVRMNKSMRSLYLNLVKMLHPDRAIDEGDRIIKEEAIKQVTKAYEDKDLSRLLALEAKWIGEISGHISEIEEDNLQLYINLLKAQVKDLETAKKIQFNSPKYENIDEYKSYSLQKALKMIDDMSFEREYVAQDMEFDLENLLQKPTKKEILQITNVISMSIQSNAIMNMFSDDWLSY